MILTPHSGLGLVQLLPDDVPPLLLGQQHLEPAKVVQSPSLLKCQPPLCPCRLLPLLNDGFLLQLLFYHTGARAAGQF